MKKNKTFRRAWAAGLGVAFLGTAAAFAHSGGPKGRFARLDTSGDGRVDYAEFQAGGEARIQRWFERVDSDGDGALTMAEVKAHRMDKRQKRFERIDVDGDGSLSPEELKAAKKGRRGRHRGD